MGPLNIKEPTPGWMITFADLMAVILSFFVLMYAMQAPRGDTWNRAAASLRGSLGTGVEQAPRPVEGSRIAQARAIDLSYLAGIVGEKMAADRTLQRATMTRRDDRIIVSLPADLLFRGGSADLAPEAGAAVAALAEAVRFVANRVEVQGHADPQPIDRAWRSNWDLSLARALTVANALRAAGYSRPVGAYGLGDSRFTELDATMPMAERYRLARRVDIVLREGTAE